jgi:hypothetical protein
VTKFKIHLLIAASAALFIAMRHFSAFAQQAPPKNPGEFQIEKIGAFKVIFKLAQGVYGKDGSIQSTFTGGPGGKVQATTTRYDLNAPRVAMVITRDNAPETAEATGGVTGQARSPERQQAVAFRGDKAVYRAAKGTNAAHIDFTGNVRFVFRSPQFATADPLTLNAESGSLIFSPKGSIAYRLNSGDASGTPVEPTPAPKAGTK